MHSPSTSSADFIAEPKVIIIDNYDSFTFNIREAIAKLGIHAHVIRNDELDEEAFDALNPSHIILGPGPGTPECPADVGISFHAIDYAQKHGRAVLGVCLGHQALAKHFGGLIQHAPVIKHGKTSTLRLERPDLPDQFDLFQGVENLDVMRYHSLAVTDLPPENLKATSHASDQEASTIMSLQHTKLPIFGVQFHPESFATPDGARILENFLRSNPVAYEELKRRGIPESDQQAIPSELPASFHAIMKDMPERPFTLQEFPCELPPEEVFARLHAQSDHAYALESLETHPGDTAGPYSYFGFQPSFVLSARNNQLFLDDKEIETGDVSPMDVFQALSQKFSAGQDKNTDVPAGQSLTGGFVGYMAYETAQYREPVALAHLKTPDNQKTFAFGYFPDGLTYSRQTQTYQYYTRGEDRSEIFRKAIAGVQPSEDLRITQKTDVNQSDYEKRVQYIRDAKIREGETFQTVLSHKKTFAIEGSMMALYRRLRQTSPSQNMHAIKMGDSESIGSLPELVLGIHDGEAAAHLLAGTIARTGSVSRDTEVFACLSSDPKERAEHMMLLDLERNDLSRSSIPGTVFLPEELLMHRLDAGRVMHIASEVRSCIAKNISPIAVLLDVTPMGTVSGAPKIRSMQIIHEEEQQEPRGLYAGSFGFVDVRGDLEMVVGLRSLMRQGNELTVQAGAGIVYDSDPSSEFKETIMKMQVALNTIQPFLSSDSSNA